MIVNGFTLACLVGAITLALVGVAAHLDGHAGRAARMARERRALRAEAMRRHPSAGRQHQRPAWHPGMAAHAQDVQARWAALKAAAEADHARDMAWQRAAHTARMAERQTGRPAPVRVAAQRLDVSA